MHTRISVVEADAIYATNKNRTFATSHQIRTDFKRKGRASKHFGKEKEHYHLKKVKVRTKKTEILWIFFGVHTVNALKIGRRMTRDAIQLAA